MCSSHEAENITGRVSTYMSKYNMMNTLMEAHHKFSVKILILNVHFLVC